MASILLSPVLTLYLYSSTDLGQTAPQTNHNSHNTDSQTNDNLNPENNCNSDSSDSNGYNEDDYDNDTDSIQDDPSSLNDTMDSIGYDVLGGHKEVCTQC